MDRIFSGLPDEKKWILEKMEKFLAYLFSGPNHKEIEPTNWGKYQFNRFFEPETAKRAYRETELYRDAVLIVSYPRTGSNWTTEIVRQILYGDDEKLDEISKAVPSFVMTILETFIPEKFDLVEHIPLPRKIFYSHLPVELVNLETIKKYNGKIILLNRNPKDQAVSWYHFAHNVGLTKVEDECPPDWNKFFDTFVAGKQRTMMPEGEFYPDFLRDWYKHKDDENVMVLTYEKLKKNYKDEIKNIAKFLEVEITDERAAEIAGSTEFKSMKKRQVIGDDDNQKHKHRVQMVRKGKVGEWKEVFSVSQSEKMDRIVKERLGDTDIKFIYE